MSPKNKSDKNQSNLRIRASWKLSESISVINIVNEYRLLSRLDDKSTKKSKIYEKISDELGTLDPPIVRTTTQVKNHWKFLQSEFQKYKRIAEKSGEAAVHWSLYQEMMALIGDRPKAKFVEMGIDSSVPLEINLENLEDDSAAFNARDESPSSVQGSMGSGDSYDDISEAGSPASTSTGSSSRKRPLLENLKPAPVKKSRSEKSMEVLLLKHQETAASQQQTLLEAFDNFRKDDKSDRERELQSQREWESKEAEKQRQWEKDMIQWRTSQTNSMLLQLSNSFSQSIAQVAASQAGQVHFVQLNPDSPNEAE